MTKFLELQPMTPYRASVMAIDIYPTTEGTKEYFKKTGSLLSDDVFMVTGPITIKRDGDTDWCAAPIIGCNRPIIGFMFIKLDFADRDAYDLFFEVKAEQDYKR